MRSIGMEKHCYGTEGLSSGIERHEQAMASNSY